MQLTMIKVLPTSLLFNRCGVEGLAVIAMMSQTDLLREPVMDGTFVMVLLDPTQPMYDGQERRWKQTASRAVWV